MTFDQIQYRVCVVFYYVILNFFITGTEFDPDAFLILGISKLAQHITSH